MQRDVAVSTLRKLSLSAFIEMRLQKDLQLGGTDLVLTSPDEPTVDTQNRAAFRGDMNVRGTAFARRSNNFLDAHRA